MSGLNATQLSVIIPWCDRPVLATTLVHNSGYLSSTGIETVIVNGGGNKTGLKRMVSGHGWPGISIIDSPERAFNKAECLNIGAAHARAATLFILDADIALSGDFVERAMEAVRLDPTCFVSVATVVESDPQRNPQRWNPQSALRRKVFTTKLVAASGRTATVEYRWTRNGTRTGPGLIVVARKHFIAVQGFNSALKDWGFEDYDFQIRLQLLLGLKRKAFGKVRHLSHEAPPRRGEDTRNEQVCFRNYENGLLLGTYDADNARPAQG